MLNCLCTINIIKRNFIWPSKLVCLCQSTCQRSHREKWKIELKTEFSVCWFLMQIRNQYVLPIQKPIGCWCHHAPLIHAIDNGEMLGVASIVTKLLCSSFPIVLTTNLIRSVSDLGSSPVSSLGVVSDLVISSVSDPVWKRSVGLCLLGQLGFLREWFYWTHFSILFRYT